MSDLARDLSGLRKAAILFLALGEDASATVFPHLRDEEIQELTREIAILDKATTDEIQVVMEEFHTLAMARTYVLQGGVEYAKKVLRQSLPPVRCREILDRLTKYLDQGPGFQNLRKADPRLLSKIIQKEHPQTIAFILSHLDIAKAAHAVASLPTELQVEVARRMANLEEISPDVVKKVSAVLDKKIVTMAGSSIEVQGVKTVAEILNRMSRNEAKGILDKLEQENPELAAHIRQLMFVFDDIQFLPDKAIQEILKRTDKNALTIALKGTSDELREKFFRNMSSRAVETLREEMGFMGPIRVSEVTEAQAAITEIVRQLEEEGVIVLSAGEQDDYIS
ncbi:MAG: flagellar motor switch protein FliG [Deltaproteobacteria bacterium]|nr:flagellar motor switch protein FliG [Deltaproteobacteria bacterium]